MKKILVVLALVLLGSVSYAQWSTNGSMIYYNGGYVGIGTSAPTEILQVVNPSAQSAILMQRPAGVAGNNTIGAIRLMNSGAGAGDYFNFSFRYQGGNHEIIQSAFYAPTSTFKAFSYFNFTTGKYEVRNGVVDVEFLNTGKVSFNGAGVVGIGMGTMAIPAGSKLAVGGKVVCKEVEVTLTGLPDFVFNSDYKLMSLYEVENFVNTNKHLPNVPSEKEVIENGLNLGDMNATLLQKVEELTLYMINLQKENDALKVRVGQLEK
jgi:hypothetical protein